MHSDFWLQKFKWSAKFKHIFYDSVSIGYTFKKIHNINKHNKRNIFILILITITIYTLKNERYKSKKTLSPFGYKIKVHKLIVKQIVVILKIIKDMLQKNIFPRPLGQVRVKVRHVLGHINLLILLFDKYYIYTSRLTKVKTFKILITLPLLPHLYLGNMYLPKGGKVGILIPFYLLMQYQGWIAETFRSVYIVLIIQCVTPWQIYDQQVFCSNEKQPSLLLVLRDYPQEFWNRIFEVILYGGWSLPIYN